VTAASMGGTVSEKPALSTEPRMQARCLRYNADP